MKAKYLNPYISAATSVLNQFIPDIDIDRGELEVVEQPGRPRAVTVYIGISGDLEGRVIYEMDKSTAVNLASSMNGEELDEFNDMVRSTIQELSNIISGNASQELESNSDSKSVSITPPSLIIGEETEILDSVSESFIQVPLQTDEGKILINLAVREP